ncbi:MAG: hypothetical protein HZA19_02435 [Nitrospirae bacterium]|nr:hypothetical protein [Nitrospirota bacterium]
MALRSFSFVALPVFLAGLLVFSCGPLGPDVSSRKSGDYPLLTSAAALSRTQVRIVWQDRSSGEEGFGIERRQAGNQGSSPGNFALRSKVDPNTESYVDEGLISNTTYYYRVYYYAGDDKSSYSNIVTVSTPE